MKLFLVMLGLALVPHDAEGQKKGSLYGWVVVVDPGHGGQDPGSSRMHGGARVTEDEYVYDVALRVQRLIRERQGISILTITDKIGERNLSPAKKLPDSRTERFAVDGTLVRARQSGLDRRIALGNITHRRYPNHKQAWISIHFDALGSSPSIKGVRIIAADTASRLARALRRSFGIENRLREKSPVVKSGDRAHGIRRLYVLNSSNQIGERVLIELGNFRNDIDLWRIRDPKVREAYALAIVRALEMY